jgi:hypothetical protein
LSPGNPRSCSGRNRTLGKDFEAAPVYWLGGIAGTGKSTIAETIAERMFSAGRLGASFFCSRDFEDRSNLQLIFPTLARQLAYTHPEFRPHFLKIVQSNSRLLTASLSDQLTGLIVQPLKESGVSTMIIIDAVDECNDRKYGSILLSVLGQLTSENNVKFFLTGRPEPRISATLQSQLVETVTLTLHTVDNAHVASDIRRFFVHRFSELSKRRGIPGGWPTEGDLKLLCSRAEVFFVYAVATVKFLEFMGKTPQDRLQELLESPWSTKFEGKVEYEEKGAKGGPKTLDRLYLSILEAAYQASDSVDMKEVRSVLGAVVLAANPLSPSAIETLLGLPPSRVFPSFRWLGHYSFSKTTPTSPSDHSISLSETSSRIRRGAPARLLHPHI